ncbi:MAG TPA: primosomal protein N' [Rubricoccaceae bacterium]
MPHCVGVVPLAPVEGVFTYRMPAALAGEAGVGARVLIPFGRRTVTGVVVQADAEASETAREIVDVLDPPETGLTAELLALTQWVAAYTLCSWGEALRAALPSGTDVESRRTVRAQVASWPDADGQAVLDALAGRDGLTTAALAEALGRATAPTSLLRRMEAAGAVSVEDEMQAARARPRVMKHLRLASGGDGAAGRDGATGDKQRLLLDLLARGPQRQAEALREAGASASTVASLARLGLVDVYDAEVERRADGLDEDPPAPPPALDLHPAQTAALAAIVGAVEAHRPATFLLDGVTGSGKTEVYLRALRACLDAGRTALVLVPEIALTPQTVRRFTAHFPGRVAVMHSRMSPGERLDAWTRIRSGRYPVVVGPRSAVFAPVERLGLIVVDEEHEASYKQFDPAPRYHARDVAVMRAHRAGAVCVLGSATPSLETVANVRAGKYVRLEMAERVPVNGREPAPLPPVRVVDLTREREIRRLKGALSHPLREAIQARLDRGEQTILLQNRRGYAPVLQCEDCGHTPMCRDCAVSLTVHKTSRNLRCHTCGRAERLPQMCPSCGGPDLRQLGAGTQRVEEEVADVFPEARVLRMDLDTTARRGAHRQLLDRFGRGEADILLGTQMVAKGLDFPRVTLVGVVDADTGMLLPDFRASERAFQLLAQVAGRAGRHDLPGEVFLQTRNPDHPAVRFALAHDVAGFARHEMSERQLLDYPPFVRLVGVEFKGPHDRSTRDFADRWTVALHREAGTIAGTSVLGPVPAFVGRIKGFWRVHTLLKAPRALPSSVLGAALRRVVAAVPPPNGHRVNVDVDPVGLF